MAVRVLLAEDHSLLRNALRELLAREVGVEVVAEAEDGEAAVRRAEQVRPDVVLMDLNLPRLSGIEATRRIRAASSATKVLIVSCQSEPELVDEARRAGACGYVVKNRAVSDLPAALCRIIAGGVFFGPGVADGSRGQAGMPVMPLVPNSLQPPMASDAARLS